MWRPWGFPDGNVNCVSECVSSLQRTVPSTQVVREKSKKGSGIALSTEQSGFGIAVAESLEAVVACGRKKYLESQQLAIQHRILRQQRQLEELLGPPGHGQMGLEVEEQMLDGEAALLPDTVSLASLEGSESPTTDFRGPPSGGKRQPPPNLFPDSDSVESDDWSPQSSNDTAALRKESPLESRDQEEEGAQAYEDDFEM